MKVGIDLGTTYSLISRLGPDGKAILIPDHSDKDIFATPSAAYITKGNAIIGSLVDTLLEQNPELPVLRFFKRKFGTGEPVYFDKDGNAWHAEALGALVLKKLRYDAESYTGAKIESAVITVPAHFNDLQRKGVIHAAAMAEIPVLGLVEEPVSAALHYGISHNSNGQVLLVYDLGGGTFDATVLSMDEKGVYVLAKDGLTDLGGKEFDERVATFVLEQFEKTLGHAPELNAFTLLQLRRISEEIKIELSLPNVNFLRKTILLGYQAIDITLNRREFEKAIHESIEKTIAITLRCLDAAGLKEQDIDALLLVGGSSMIPYIRERLRKLFPDQRQKIFFHEPMKAVAFGASIHASQLSGEASMFNIPPEFKGITGYNVGIKTLNSRTGRTEIDTLIKKNMPLPAKGSRTYYTHSETQRKISLEVVQYLESSSEYFDIGTVTIGPIPQPRMNYAVEVTLSYTDDGVIKISAFDPNTGIELEQEFGSAASDDNLLLQQRRMVKSININTL